MDRVKIKSEEEFLKANQEYVNTRLANVKSARTVADIVHRVGNTWCPASRHKFSRCIRGYSWGSELEYIMYLGKDDSLSSLVTLFEALESLLPDIEWLRTKDTDSSRIYYCKWKGLSVDFRVKPARSESCKMVQIYETKSVVVGHKAVCR